VSFFILTIKVVAIFKKFKNCKKCVYSRISSFLRGWATRSVHQKLFADYRTLCRRNNGQNVRRHFYEQVPESFPDGFTFRHSCRFPFFSNAERSDPFHPAAIANANDRRWMSFLRGLELSKSFFWSDVPAAPVTRYVHRETQYRRRDVGARIFCFGRDDTARKIYDPRFSDSTSNGPPSPRSLFYYSWSLRIF